MLPSSGETSFQQMLATLRPVLELNRLVAGVLDDMGLGPVVASDASAETPPAGDFHVLHFLLLPNKEAWCDFLLETDRDSALKIYQTLSGETNAGDADLHDVLRETMNMIHGSLKIAFKRDAGEVIVPVVPQSITTEKLHEAAPGYSLQSRHVFAAPGLVLRLTMIAHLAPVARRPLDQLHLSQVLVEPLASDGNSELVLVKRHTMLNQRMLDKVHNLAECEPAGRTLPVIEPSPMASVVFDL